MDNQQRVQKRIKIKVKSKHKDTKMGKNISWVINKGGAGAEINFWFLHLRAIAFLLILKKKPWKELIGFAEHSFYPIVLTKPSSSLQNCIFYYLGKTISFSRTADVCFSCRDYGVIAPWALINERASRVHWHYVPFPSFFLMPRLFPSLFSYS